MHLYQERYLSLENGRRLPGLGLDQRGAHHIVEADQILGDRSASLHIERGLQMSEYQDRVIEVTSARFDVGAVEGGPRAAQVFNGLLVELNHQPHRAGALYRRFAIRKSWVHCSRVRK
jgi:hypothetical protein